MTLVVAGCVHYGAEFVPASGAQEVIGAKNTAVSTDAGVTVAVSGKRWSGHPDDLGALVTPMRVDITNRSGQPVRLSHDMFALVGAKGVTEQALSPFDIQRPGSGGYSGGPYYGFGGGYWGGYWGGWPGWGWGGYGGPWGYGGYWGPYYYYREPLPSHDMIQRALPEGVLADGGTASGYVYFPYVGEEAGQVQFKADVVSAKTDQQVAEITVPLVAKG
ncbi:MAG TPA: hypothetical protein VGK67_00835 [Myxococcales bacterium]